MRVELVGGRAKSIRYQPAFRYCKVGLYVGWYKMETPTFELSGSRSRVWQDGKPWLSRFVGDLKPCVFNAPLRGWWAIIKKARPLQIATS
jgi:hypothetical protein